MKTVEKNGLTQTFPTHTILEEWVAKINQLGSNEAMATIKYALKVAEAKSALVEHGEWTKLCKSGKVAFKKSKGDMLARVGTSFRQLNDQTLGHLPAGWSILHCLSVIPIEILQQKIKSGEIHPLLSLALAKELAAPYRMQKNKQPNVQAWLNRCKTFVEEKASEWTESEATLVQESLTQLAELITSESTSGA